MADPAQHKRETAPGLADQWHHGAMATPYVYVFLPAAQQLALAPLLGPYRKAYRAPQLRSLRRSPADLITGRITLFFLCSLVCICLFFSAGMLLHHRPPSRASLPSLRFVFFCLSCRALWFRSLGFLSACLLAVSWKKSNKWPCLLFLLSSVGCAEAEQPPCCSLYAASVCSSVRLSVCVSAFMSFAIAPPEALTIPGSND